MVNKGTDSNAIVKWLKKIFSWQVLSAIFTLASVYWGYNQFVRDQGGNITAYIDNSEVYVGDKRNIIVFLDNENREIPRLPLIPILRNNEEYSVRDFLLQYQITANDIFYIPSDFYSSFIGRDGNTLRYKENTLYSFTSAESPIDYIEKVSNNSHIDIKMRATYDGISEPYECNVSASFYIEPKSQDISFSEWCKHCEQLVQKRTDALTFNTYYISDNQFASSLIVTTSAIEDARSLQEKQQPKQEKTPKKSQNTPIVDSVQDVDNIEDNITTKADSKSLNRYNFENAPIKVTKVDTLRLADQTLVATIYFEPVKEKCDVCFVFNYRELTYDSKKIRSTISVETIYPNENQVRISFHKSLHRVELVGFANEDSSLRQFVVTSVKNDATTVHNKADVSIGIFAKCTRENTTRIVESYLSPNMRVTYSLDMTPVLDDIKTFSMSNVDADRVDWRETRWERAFYRPNLSEHLFWMIMLPLCMLPIGYILLSSIAWVGVIIIESIKEGGLNYAVKEIANMAKEMVEVIIEYRVICLIQLLMIVALIIRYLSV